MRSPSLLIVNIWISTYTIKIMAGDIFQAMAIGKAASKLIEEELKMEYIYDYMFHLLNQYSKLLTFKPTVPPNATELSSDSLASAAKGSIIRKSMMESVVTSPAESSPCALQPPYDPQSLQLLFRRKEDSIKQVEKWERSFSKNGWIVQQWRRKFSYFCYYFFLNSFWYFGLFAINLFM